MMNTYKGVVTIAINQEGFGYKHYNLNYAGNVFIYLRVPSVLISVLIYCSTNGWTYDKHWNQYCRNSLILCSTIGWTKDKHRNQPLKNNWALLESNDHILTPIKNKQLFWRQYRKKNMGAANWKLSYYDVNQNDTESWHKKQLQFDQ